MRKRLLIGLPAVIVVALVVWQALGHSTPAGQRPLANITAASLAAFEHDFDQSADRARVIVLLSPT